MTNQQQLDLLKQGSATIWNTWREKHPDTAIELNLVDLSEANLGEVNLTEADLSESDLSGADLNGANLSKARLVGAEARRFVESGFCIYLVVRNL
ncbi:MAG TPA: pentapeptide repeat-containing protein [Ktedonobacteraceae bacterium]